MTSRNIQLFLRSTKADLSMASGCMWLLQRPLLIVPQSRLRVMLSSLNLWHTFRGVTTENNSLILGGTTITIPVGCYSATSLVTQLNSSLSSTNVSVAFSSDTLHFTFSDSTGAEYTLSGSSTSLSILGFSDGDHTSTGGVLESDGVCNLSSPPAILVQTSLWTHNIDSEAKAPGSTILASVPLRVTYGQLISYTPNFENWSEVQAQAVQVIAVNFLSSRDGSYLDLQGQDFDLSLTLQIEEPAEAAPDLRGYFDSYFPAPPDNTADGSLQ